ncbi:MAG TPA: DUF2027 domain-containing protein [Paludibacteraceae bacterium]|nr:DUF2027 domain-containing protein [Paludibacteraceae bacterium]
MIKKGDHVRFLNAVGGGIVTHVDEKNKIIYVADNDGFEVPVLANECVVIPAAVNGNTNFPIRDFTSENAKENTPSLSENKEPAFSSLEKKIEIPEETSEGDTLKLFLAFVPTNIKQLPNTSYECYLINDSNYYLFYNISLLENAAALSLANGLIEPNMQELFAEITPEQLTEWQKINFQTIAYKKDKEYSIQRAIDVNIEVEIDKFYKLHCFTENDYFDQPALLIDILLEKEKQQFLEIPEKEIKKVISQKEIPSNPHKLKKLKKPQIIEVDLHIEQLIDNPAGMSNFEMLQLQLNKCREVLEMNKNNKGQKIVFIHGKGEGVLKKEIQKLLETQYKKFYFQDASFQQYGFGATMITIR